jgi:UDP-2-acetamido-3-amino-2,3-dideoxy-glucuronate N-acetyltransferase
MAQTARALVSETADVDPTAEIGDRTRIWHLSQIREGARIGRECIIGRGAYVGPGVVVGDRCKIQNHALLYEPAVVEDGVFIGPGVVFTNDYFPRAVDPDGRLKDAHAWTAVAVTVRTGASIGARAVCVAPITVGRWSMVAAGAVVIRDVPDFALVAGVPARRIRWVGHAGVPLQPLDGRRFRCPVTERTYAETGGTLEAEDDER